MTSTYVWKWILAHICYASGLSSKSGVTPKYGLKLSRYANYALLLDNNIYLQIHKTCFINIELTLLPETIALALWRWVRCLSPVEGL
jgi:hypothetical protein